MSNNRFICTKTVHFQSLISDHLSKIKICDNGKKILIETRDPIEGNCVRLASPCVRSARSLCANCAPASGKLPED